MPHGLAGRDCTGRMTDGAPAPGPTPLLLAIFSPGGGASQSAAETQQGRLLVPFFGADLPPSLLAQPDPGPSPRASDGFLASWSPNASSPLGRLVFFVSNFPGSPQDVFLYWKEKCDGEKAQNFAHGGIVPIA